MYRLQLLELCQHRPRNGRVVTTSFQFCDSFALSSDILRADCDVLLSERQMFQ
jgi:hypothetical protein